MVQRPARRHQKQRPAIQKIDGRMYQTPRRPSSVILCRKPQETARVGAEITTWPVNTWLLRGELGAGKTTLVRGALRKLGYTGAVTSPTYTLSHIYTLRHPIWKRLVHIDAYRVKDISEEAALDLEPAVADPACLVFIEWPERLQKHPWKRAGTVRFAHHPNGRRLVIQCPA